MLLEESFGISLSNTDNLLQRITDAVPTVTRGFLYILFVIEDIGTSLKIVLEILKIVGSLLQLLFQGVRLIFDAITLIIGLIPGASGLLSALYSNLAAIDNVIGDIAKNFGRIAALSNNLLNGASLRARVDAIIAGLAEEEAKQLERIRREQELIGEAESNISSRRRVDLTTLIRTTSEMLKQSAALRSQVSSVKQIISLTLQGGLPRGVRALVSGNVIGLADQVRAQIADLVKVLLSAETLLTRANLFSSIADPDDIKKLELQIERVKGEILALGADLIALNAIFADIAETTVAAFTRILSRDVSAVVFGNLLSFLRGEATSLTSVFMGLTASIKEFITSAEVQVALIAAIGNALSNAITQAIQGARSLGEALKGILGGILIAIGQLLIQMGSASLLFGIITLNAQAVAYGLLAIAAGTAAIAVGSAIGGSGGGGGGGGGGGTATSAGSPTFTFRQQDIVTQQLSSATEGLRITSENLNEATKNIGGVKPGEVFTKGADQAGGITRVLANDVRRGDRFTATRDAALAFGGS